MTEFISEAILPTPGGFDAEAMARGEPGLPAGFRWRERTFQIRRRQSQWKQSGPEIGRYRGESYLRRHYYSLVMDDGAVWTVYFVRQTPRNRSTRSACSPTAAAKQRWFLYAIDLVPIVDELP